MKNASAARARRIAVVGSGPAGATVAALLAKKGADVVLLDDGARPPLVVGESLVPQLVPVFRRLGIEDEVARIGVKKPGVTVTFCRAGLNRTAPSDTATLVALPRRCTSKMVPMSRSTLSPARTSKGRSPS